MVDVSELRRSGGGQLLTCDRRGRELTIQTLRVLAPANRLAAMLALDPVLYVLGAAQARAGKSRPRARRAWSDQSESGLPSIFATILSSTSVLFSPTILYLRPRRSALPTMIVGPSRQLSASCLRPSTLARCSAPRRTLFSLPDLVGNLTGSGKSRSSIVASAGEGEEGKGKGKYTKDGDVLAYHERKVLPYALSLACSRKVGADRKTSGTRPGSSIRSSPTSKPTRLSCPTAPARPSSPARRPPTRIKAEDDPG